MTERGESLSGVRELFGTVELEYGGSVATDSDGDLWPSAWADDGGLYTANGDGAGFSDGAFDDIVVNRIDGTIESGLRGRRLASGRDVSPVWSDPALFNAKPTGMIAVDGDHDGRDELYLAVQDLATPASPDAFNIAPAASIVRSADRGLSWQSTAQPMFTDGVFTTIMFLDFGRSNTGSAVLGDADAPFAYCYGLDGNWRGSYNGAVPDPQELYLARVPVDGIQERERWEFFRGLDGDGRPLWTADIAARAPVLRDGRRLYPEIGVAGDPSAPRSGGAAPYGYPEFPGYGAGGQSVLGQGGVVYNAVLGRYIFTSWSEFTFQFYAAPRPWGPWQLFHQQDFGPFPWRGPRSEHPKHGGYGTTIPSKFISADGRTMWLQSNWFWRADAYSSHSYHFSLRKLVVVPYDRSDPDNGPDASRNLADRSTGAVPAASMCRSGVTAVLNDGRVDRSEDSWNGRPKREDHWGYRWPRRHRIDTVVFTSGPRDYGSGWFEETPSIMVRADGAWRTVDATCSPAYPADSTATGNRRYVFRFPPIAVDGVLLVGTPAGRDAYTTVAELEVSFRG